MHKIWAFWVSSPERAGHAGSDEIDCFYIIVHDVHGARTAVAVALVRDQGVAYVGQCGSDGPQRRWGFDYVDRGDAAGQVTHGVGGGGGDGGRVVGFHLG